MKKESTTTEQLPQSTDELFAELKQAIDRRATLIETEKYCDEHETEINECYSVILNIALALSQQYEQQREQNNEQPVIEDKPERTNRRLNRRVMKLLKAKVIDGKTALESMRFKGRSDILFNLDYNIQTERYINNLLATLKQRDAMIAQLQNEGKPSQDKPAAARKAK